MNIKHLLNDEDAVSPVIGVILMVAITVILAAVIGTFVLGLGDQVQSSAPNANFNFDYDEGTSVTVTHNGGQDVDSANLRITSSDDTIDQADPGFSGGTTVSTGDSWTSSSYPSTGATVRVIWESPSGGTSNTIGESTVP